MKVYAEEIYMIADQIVLLSNTVTPDYEEAIGKPSPDVLQNALYSIAQHLYRISDEL
ncbi:MAG: hypothetical protein IKE62_01215 [Oscillospiraceae bacterium]|nr:hypothetical protein [Oscillospiraceae bacterium]